MEGFENNGRMIILHISNSYMNVFCWAQKGTKNLKKLFCSYFKYEATYFKIKTLDPETTKTSHRADELRVNETNRLRLHNNPWKL